MVLYTRENPIKMSVQFMPLVDYSRGHLVEPLGLKIGAKNFKGLQVK